MKKLKTMLIKPIVVVSVHECLNWATLPNSSLILLVSHFIPLDFVKYIIKSSVTLLQPFQ